MATEVVYPTGEGALTQYVPQGAGDNYVEVDDPVGSPDDDTTYNYRQDADGRDALTFDTPTLSGATSINKMTLYTRARKVQSTYMQFKERVTVGGSGFNGASNTVNTSYANYNLEYATNPATSNPWSIDEIKGIAGSDELQEFGYYAQSMGSGEEQRTTQCYMVIDFEASSGYSLTAEAGAYTLTGSEATLQKDSLLPAAAGAYALTGPAVDLLRSLIVAAESGAYIFTGMDVTLTYSQGFILDAEGGSYVITGPAANLLYDRLIGAAAGAYVWTGQDATLTYAQGATLFCDPGSYLLAGAAAALQYARRMPAAAGSYAITGPTAALLLQRVLSAAGGAYGLSGTAAGLLHDRLLAAAAGSLVITGTDAALDYSGAIIPAGLVTISYTIKKPAAGFTAQKPAVTFTT